MKLIEKKRKGRERKNLNLTTTNQKNVEERKEESKTSVHPGKSNFPRVNQETPSGQQINQSKGR